MRTNTLVAILVAICTTSLVHGNPTTAPTSSPSTSPSSSPTLPTPLPTAAPTSSPTLPTPLPTAAPTQSPISVQECQFVDTSFVEYARETKLTIQDPIGGFWQIFKATTSGHLYNIKAGLYCDKKYDNGATVTIFRLSDTPSSFFPLSGAVRLGSWKVPKGECKGFVYGKNNMYDLSLPVPGVTRIPIQEGKKYYFQVSNVARNSRAHLSQSGSGYISGFSSLSPAGAKFSVFFEVSTFNCTNTDAPTVSPTSAPTHTPCNTVSDVTQGTHDNVLLLSGVVWQSMTTTAAGFFESFTTLVFCNGAPGTVSGTAVLMTGQGDSSGDELARWAIPEYDCSSPSMGWDIGAPTTPVYLNALTEYTIVMILDDSINFVLSENSAYPDGMSSEGALVDIAFDLKLGVGCTPKPTGSPTPQPTKSPSKTPTNSPSTAPTQMPTGGPTKAPSGTPTSTPSASPTTSPTAICTTTAVSQRSFDNANVVTDNFWQSFISPDVTGAWFTEMKIPYICTDSGATMSATVTLFEGTDDNVANQVEQWQSEDHICSFSANAFNTGAPANKLYLNQLSDYTIKVEFTSDVRLRTSSANPYKLGSYNGDASTDLMFDIMTERVC